MDALAGNEPLVVEGAAGAWLVDVDGRRYLDAISSLWVTTLGHRVPELDAALRDQVDRVAHTTMLGHGNRAVVELAEALARVVPVDDPHFLFASDGSAAVEQALKIAWQHWANRGRIRTTFLALGDAYHGDTVGSMSLGDDDGFGSEVFAPLRFPVLRTPGYAHRDWSAAAVAMIEAHREDLAAVVIEPLVQGAGGILVADPEDVRAVGDACRRHGVLLICDEVATGFGRTGSLFASERCGLRPDLLVLGKGITGGYLPMSATVVSGAVFASFRGEDLGPETLYHGHSYGGNALAAAVATRHLALLEEWNVLDGVRARAVELAAALGALASRPEVAAVRTCGLMAGVELAPPAAGRRWGRRVCNAAVRRGVLLRPLGDVVVVMPHLTVTSEQLALITTVLADAIDEVAREDALTTAASARS